MNVFDASEIGGNHCQDLKGDRQLGGYWERQFCIMAANHDKTFTPMQLGRQESIVAHRKNGQQWNSYTLPDVTVWTSPGEHHEIKHKDPFDDWDNGPSYGLEVYRFNALLWFAEETGQQVMYTIHDHKKAGGRDIKNNNIEHWVTANIKHLNNQWHTCRETKSYVNGETKIVPTYYWSIELWLPLGIFWKLV